VRVTTITHPHTSSLKASNNINADMPNKAKTNAIASGGMLLNIFAPDHLSASQTIFKANSQRYPRENF
jgi:hypothetical protein